jgi:primosomal protein N' (replication factor Y)|tara:strand:+ start:13725 stop:15938 length:2214 start_codon:yes stop_codon:yes gene_type:complete
LSDQQKQGIIKSFVHNELVSVLTTQPINRFLDYKVPFGGLIQGSFVEVPLGPRKVIGVVWGPGQGGYDPKKIRSISNILEIAPMHPEMQEFLTRVGRYTLTSLNAMLRLATRAPGLGDPPSMRKVYALGDAIIDRMTPAREKVLATLKNTTDMRFTAHELKEEAGVSLSVIKGLVAQNAIIELETPRDTPYPNLDPFYPSKKLTSAQMTASKKLRSFVAMQSYNTTLLRGVTGSGKTEVYLEAVAECLSQGRQALVLIPEIALTVEFLDRVEKRFGKQPAQWHSGVTMTEKRRCWRMVGAGQAQIVIGARSSLFLPFDNLGLIVVDEEHDTSYKQEDGVLYSARDMAVMRASISGGSVVLASATPSLETWANAQAGKYNRIDLTERFGAALMPDMATIDMREQLMGTNSWISSDLGREIDVRLERSEQSLLFLNRRGYAPITVCRKCGEQIGCDHCDARMVEHRFQGHLMCHQCGETKKMPEECPSCKEVGSLSAVGPGVERLAEEAEKRFPDAKISVLSSDMLMSAKALKQRISAIAAGEADIIIGTQLVAKGHNFPLLTLVGVIDSDLALMGGDLRAAERTFQLMRQVAGRAGRSDKKGIAYLQTHQPDHPVIKAILNGDEEEFWQAEANQRLAAGMPPFGRLAGIVLKGPDITQVFNLANHMVRNAPMLDAIGAEIYGPAPAPIARVRDNHRVRILVKAPKEVTIQGALAQWRDSVQIPRDIHISIDIDPQTFY